ncbi:MULTISPECIES: hypothetical protein [Cupriavidus]|uniref:Uncharacterized protein n=3 Tax=Cupriavidus TaxID=106589 RepID=A0AAI8UZA0_CUPMC|nr:MULTISPECIES: hypothetical protein [Cupriavidus]HBD37232.1 hypothetical protein [Cupriavidus sp.]AZG12042.1 hypothetical protein EHF44_00740 [Cupriavidus pauculus]MWL91708.1 hypothetical protein [Cupriavidus sp. SW-Y-13]QBP14455.1 hypothetical protein DDF84_032600 [Cupriavidus metallidurans]QGS31200.1 hypothetical protein FOB83_19945 [Cupriavidus metallidurans]
MAETKHHKAWWAPVAHFAAHTVVGTLIFLIIGSVAVGLSLLIRFLETVGIPTFTLQVISFLEHTITIVDAVLYLVYLGITGYRAVKEMLE